MSEVVQRFSAGVAKKREEKWRASMCLFKELEKTLAGLMVQLEKAEEEDENDDE